MAKSIGRQIHDARVAQDLTLEDLRHELKIPLNLLADIETDDYSNFANLTYAKCFLKLYSERVGVDLQEYLSEFGTDSLGSLSSHGLIIDSHEAFNLAIDQTKASSDDGFSSERGKNPLWRGLAAILLIGGGIWSWQTFAPRAASATANPVIPAAKEAADPAPLATRATPENSTP
jgi:cytoskeletal protein RodZ